MGNAKTRGAVLEQTRGDQAISCVGILNTMVTESMDLMTILSCRFKDLPPDSRTPSPGAEAQIPFVEMEGAADCLLVGFPTICQWDPSFHQDSDGNIWLELKKLNVTLLCEKPVEG